MLIFNWKFCILSQFNLYRYSNVFVSVFHACIPTILVSPESLGFGLTVSVGVALGATAIDSTLTIGVGWRRVPIQPAKYLHLWLSVKLVRTGFQNSRPLFRSQRPDHFRRGDRTRRTSTHRSQKTERIAESRPTLRNRR